jgi:hypothetical protein
MQKFLPRFIQKIDQSSTLFLTLVSGFCVHIFSTGEPHSHGRRRCEFLPGRSPAELPRSFSKSRRASPPGAGRSELAPWPSSPVGCGPRRVGSMAKPPSLTLSASPRPAPPTAPAGCPSSSPPSAMVPLPGQWCARGCSAPEPRPVGRRSGGGPASAAPALASRRRKGQLGLPAERSTSVRLQLPA